MGDEAIDTERWWRAVVESAPQALIATDAEGTVRLWNPAAERLYGWQAGEVIGRNVIEILVPDDSAGEARTIVAGLRSGESWTGPFSVRHKDGTMVRALVRNWPVLGPSGDTTGIVGESRAFDDHADPGPDRHRVAARLAGLQAVTAALARAVDRAEVAEAVFRHGLRDLGGHTGSLCLVAPGGTTVAIVHEIGYPKAVKDSWDTFPLTADLPASEAIRTGELVLLRSRAELLQRFPMPAGAPLVGDQAHAVIPLPDEDGTFFGALVVGFAEERDFDDDDVALLQALGAQCAGALRRAELFEATRAAVAAEQAARQATEEAHRGVAFLAEASSALASSLDYERTLARVVELAVPRLADWCAVFASTSAATATGRSGSWAWPTPTRSGWSSSGTCSTATRPTPSRRRAWAPSSAPARSSSSGRSTTSSSTARSPTRSGGSGCGPSAWARPPSSPCRPGAGCWGRSCSPPTGAGRSPTPLWPWGSTWPCGRGWPSTTPCCSPSAPASPASSRPASSRRGCPPSPASTWGLATRPSARRKRSGATSTTSSPSTGAGGPWWWATCGAREWRRRPSPASPATPSARRRCTWTRPATCSPTSTRSSSGARPTGRRWSPTTRPRGGRATSPGSAPSAWRWSSPGLTGPR